MRDEGIRMRYDADPLDPDPDPDPQHCFLPLLPFFPLSAPAILHTGGNLPPSPSIVLFYIATRGYIVGLFFFFLLLWCHSTLYQKLSQPAIGKNTSACHRWSGCNGIGLVDVPCAVCTIPDIHRCNHSIRDRQRFSEI